MKNTSRARLLGLISCEVALSSMCIAVLIAPSDAAIKQSVRISGRATDFPGSKPFLDLRFHPQSLACIPSSLHGKLDSL